MNKKHTYSQTSHYIKLFNLEGFHPILGLRRDRELYQYAADYIYGRNTIDEDIHAIISGTMGVDKDGFREGFKDDGLLNLLIDSTGGLSPIKKSYWDQCKDRNSRMLKKAIKDFKKKWGLK